MYGNQYINQSLTFNKYLPIAVLYFFFNSFMLPHGLLYTTILTPVFLIWLMRYRSFHNIWYFFLATIPFAVIHFMQGVDTFFYLKSYGLLFTVVVFCLAFQQFLKNCKSLRSLFRYILLINFVFVIIACIAFFIPALRDSFWLTTFVSTRLEQFPRLMMLTYEPSYYCTLLVPIAMYYLLKMLTKQLPDARIFAVLIAVPLILAFSLGILLGIPLAFAILLIWNLPRLVKKRKYRILIFASGCLLVAAVVVLWTAFPNNPLFVRITNLFRGHDSSFRGRTVEAYMLASKVAEQKSMIFGAGLGQTKLLGLELWRNYYQYNFSMNEIAIPCVMAETLAIYGIAGMLLRLGVEIFLFFKTKVYSNHYRLLLFIFIFIYQFTGSFIYNIAEYAIWIFAFTNTFEEFDKNRKRVNNGQSTTGFDSNDRF